MAVPLSVPRAVSRIRRRVADLGGQIYDDASIVEALDDSLGAIWTEVRNSSADRNLDVLAVAWASTTQVGDFERSYSLPEVAGSVRRIEIVKPGEENIEVEEALLENKEFSKIYRDVLTWYRYRDDEIRFVGDTSRHPSGVQIFYVRRWPPMHHAVASGNGTTTTMVIGGGVPTGRVVRRDLIYVGSEIEFSSGQNVDQIVRVTAYNKTTNTVTFAPALGQAVANNDAYSLLIPVDGEHSEYVVEHVSLRLLRREGNTQYIAAVLDNFSYLRQQFIKDVSVRDTARPQSIFGV